MITSLFGFSLQLPLRLPVLLGVVSLLALLPTTVLAQSDLRGCDASVEGGTLLVTGNEADNVIEIVGTERGVQVACDGVTETFAGVDEVVVEAGEGDDAVTADNSNGLLAGIATSIFGQGGNELCVFSLSAPAEELGEPNEGRFAGGPGFDLLQVIASPLADRFDIASDAESNSVEVRVTDIASGRQVANITGSELEDLTVQMGDGNDEANIFPLSGITTHLFGGGGDDLFFQFLRSYNEQDPYSGPLEGGWNGGTGYDKFTIVGGALAERFDIAPGTEANSVEVCVTDIASETPLANATGTALEVLTVEMGEGDDQANVSQPPGITLNILGQEGDDDITLIEILTEIFPVGFPLLSLLDLGPGFDVLRIMSGALADRFDITSGPEPNSLEIEVTDIASGRQVADITGSKLEDLTVQMGDGNDVANVSSPLPGITLNIFGQGGNNTCELKYELFANPVNSERSGGIFIQGGPSEDLLEVITSALADQYDVRRGEAEDAVDLQVTDIATRMPVANIVAVATELVSIKMGAGNDILNQFGSLPTVLTVLGEEGDDIYTAIRFPESTREEIGSSESYLSGGTGYDKFSYKGTTASEQYEIGGVPDLTIPDPELRVTDRTTGLQLAHVQFLAVEEVTIEAGDGDDRVEVNWDAALMSGLSLLNADLGRGNDSFLANLLPVLTEPPTPEVQTAQFEVDAGPGNDQLAFSHAAGSWFDVFFRADTGPGADMISALLEPPPDDDILGPEGLRQFQFDVVAGGNDDFVALRNQTNSDFFNVFLDANLEGGNDTFEGRGGIRDANILPGRGFDTARVTRNLLSFVREFERIETLE